MHFGFIPYGKKECVDILVRDMCAQKAQLTMKKGDQEMKVWIDCQVRYLPFGIMEFVFPAEFLPHVVNTLIPNKDEKDRYQIGDFIMKVLRKVLKFKKIPEVAKEGQFIWIKDHVNIIPIGIREDDMNYVDANGWTHEAI